MSPRPAFKVGETVRIARAGFVGMPIDAPVVIAAVQPGKKRDGYAHRYEVVASGGRTAWAYEEDLA